MNNRLEITIDRPFFPIKKQNTSAKDGQPVMVQSFASSSEDDLCAACAGPMTRVGRATAVGGHYLVRFVDDLEPEEGLFEVHEMLSFAKK